MSTLNHNTRSVDHSIENVGVLTSGGDAPGMNAAIRAVVRACHYYHLNAFGIYQGYQGLMAGDIKPLTPRSVANIINKGGTCLQSSRCLDFYEASGRQQAFTQISKRLDALVVIGGDGSFRGAEQLHKEYQIPLAGIPATIDNDIYGTDFTIGFDTAINTVVEAVDKIRDTATAHSRLFFVEVMGHDAGFIALNAGIGCGAEEILIPEADRGVERLIQSLNHSRQAGKSSNIVLVAEGNKSGSVFEIANMIQQKMPQYETKVTLLGHVQRGGSPSCADRVLASRLGVAAVQGLLAGHTNAMAGLKNDAITYTPLSQAVQGQHTMSPELLEVADIISI